MAYDILLVDDHKMMRDGLRAILERTAEFRVVGEADTGTEAVQFCKKSRPDLVVMDIGLPGMNGIEATIEILRHSPQTRVLILSIYDDENSVVSALRSGARAFVLKRASSADLIDALRIVARGGSYWSSQVSDSLLTRIQSGDLRDSLRQARRSTHSRRASCRCCAWWRKARPARISPCCSTWVCKRCAVTARC
jgi:DNA-binding NarL/FixJ family response regulator